MQASNELNDLMHADRGQLEASGQLDKWRQQQQSPAAKSPLPAAAASLKISRIEICSECQGHRLEKVLYQSMVLERTCSTCDGEGVVTRQEEVELGRQPVDTRKREAHSTPSA